MVELSCTLPCRLIILIIIVERLIRTGLCDFDNSTRSSRQQQPPPNVQVYDALVYKANAAGVAAAVTASKFGSHTVKVVEPLRMIGGMAAAGGVALMNQGGCGLSGLSGNWSRLIQSYYYGKESSNSTNRTTVVTFPRMKESERAFWELLNSSASIDTELGCHAVDVAPPVDGCLGTVYFECDDQRSFQVQSAYIIDASYDGDIMTLANVDHANGRESRSHFNESLAGFQRTDHSDEESFSGQNLRINPYDSHGNLLKYIDLEDGPLPEDGSADDKLMAFEYFVCVSKTFGNRKPFYPPVGYQPDDFLLLLRQIEALMDIERYPLGPPMSYFADVQCYDPIVQQKTGNVDCTLCCGLGPVNSDQPSLNDGWATANYSERQRMAWAHRYYIQGSLFFLANDPRVPMFTREDSKQYGYCLDEYEDFDNFPPQLYIRISNRLKGQKTLTQNNIVNPQVKKDAVAMGCWVFDQHITSRRVVRVNGEYIVRNEGFFREPILPPTASRKGGRLQNNFTFYDVPFGVMVPRNQSQAKNLLVPVCLSASSVAYSSARIENMFMDLGSAAGVAVALLLDEQKKKKHSTAAASSCSSRLTPVQTVNISAVQHVLSTVYGQRFHGVGPATTEASS